MHERHDRSFLERIEDLAGWPRGHAKPPQPRSRLLRIPSRDLWTIGLGLLGVVAAVVFVLAAAGTELLDG